MAGRRLDGKRAIVTGASKGLGRLMAAGLAAEGAQVVAMARASIELFAVDKMEGVCAVACDLRSATHVADALDEAVARLGGLDLLVNNAGLCLPAILEHSGEDDLLAQIETNLLAPIRLVRGAIPHLRASGKGQIVNVSSESAADPRACLAIYSAAKAGVEAFGTALKYELRDDNIRVTTMRVGKMDTGTIQTAWTPQAKETFFSTSARSGHLWRAGAPIDPAGPAKALVDLVSLPSDMVTDLVDLRSATSPSV